MPGLETPQRGGDKISNNQQAKTDESGGGVAIAARGTSEA